MASRRPDLQAITCGLAICAGSSDRKAYASSDAELTEAARAMERGELARAAALLGESNQPRANFLKTLVAIANEDVEQAESWIALLPDDPAADMLAEMVRLRSSGPLDLEALAHSKRHDWHFSTIYLRARDAFALYATHGRAHST